MLIKCSACGNEKEDTEFTRVKDKCNPCCHIIDYERQKEKMEDPIDGENYYLRKVILRAAKMRSKKKNLEFNLTLADLINLKNDTCPILGHKIIYKSGVDYRRSASLDRLNPNKGYVLGNVKIVSFEGNTLKNKNGIMTLLGALGYAASNPSQEEVTEEQRLFLLDFLEKFRQLRLK